MITIQMRKLIWHAIYKHLQSLREKEGTLTEQQYHTEIEMHKMQNDRSVEHLLFMYYCL